MGTNKVNLDWKNYHPSFQVKGKEPPPNVTNLDLTLFWTVLDKIQGSYYDKSAITPQKLVNGAISGMVESLDDPYTVYLPPQQNSNFKQTLAGKLEGIGAELGMDGDPNLYRIGIHSGVATLGNVGSVKRRNFTAIGDTINLSKRLEENAAPGQILVSEDVLSYAQAVGTSLDGIRLDERGTIQVKGRRQQTPVYEVHADD